MTWTAKPVDPEETYFLDVNILREDGLAVGVAVQNGDISPEEALANARKMAAAPDLLEALVGLMSYEDVPGTVDVVLVPLLRAGFSAIAKAEGRS